MWRVLRQAWFLLNRRRLERDLDEELAAHREQMAEPSRLGSEVRIREGVADALGWTHVDGVRLDVAHSVRTLFRSPAFVLAVLSLGVAVGATVAVYGTADWLLRRAPTGVVAPDALVTLRITETERADLPDRGFGLSYPQYAALRDVQDAFVDLATYGKLVGVVSTEAQSDQAVVEYVSGSYFPLLGVRPHAGRLLTTEDDVAGTPPNVVLSYAFWLAQFGGDEAAIGRTLRVNGVNTRIVGVLPRRFEGFAIDWNGPTSVWTPLAVADVLGERGLRTQQAMSFFPVVGRLKAGMTIDSVRARAPTWLAAIPTLKMPSWEGNTLLALPSSETRIGAREEAEEFLGVVLVVCVLILVAACVNLANVLLGRALLRRREFGLRTALGAGKARLLRQIVTESVFVGLCVSTIGVILGVGVAWVLATLPRVYLNRAATTPVTTFDAVDMTLVGWTIMLGLASALVFGFLPLVPFALRDEGGLLRDVPIRWAWRQLRVSAQQLVLVCQVALVISLAAMAAFYARTFIQAANVASPYGRPESVLVARVALRAVARDAREDVWTAILARLQDDPGVDAATVGWNPPYRVGIARVRPAGGNGEPIQVAGTAGAPGFFAVQQVPIVEGREFVGPDDIQTGLVINRTLAKALGHANGSVGQSVVLNGIQRTITGVVADEHCRGLLEPPHACTWQPWTPAGSALSYVRIRTKGDPLDFIPRLQAILHEVHPDVALAEPAALDAALAEIVEPQRNAAFVAASLAGFGVMLLVIGTSSLFLSMVRDRRREIAVRMAIGATRRTLATRIMLQGSAIVLVGVVVGVALAYTLAGLVEEQLFQVQPTDVLALVIVPLGVAIVALGSVGIAAWEAATVQPARHLQAQ
jgi:putative ABC transport system permease protein